MKEYIVRCETSKIAVEGEIVRCKDCIHCADDWNGNEPMFTCELARCCESVYPNDYCSYGEKQVTGKLNNPDDSLFTEDAEACKEQESKLDLIRREDAIDAIDDAIDADSPQWAILRTKIGFLPSADRPKGEWAVAYLDHESVGVRPRTLYCSECNWLTSFPSAWCPNCGAKMKGEEK